MKIDHTSPVPFHMQVERLLRGMLKKSRYQNGELLPPEERMAEQLGVCRNTVRTAISRLVQEGVLERRAGRGTRYVRQPVQTSLDNWPSFTREMEAKGIKVEVFSCRVEETTPSSRIAQLLHLSDAQRKREVITLERVRGFDGIPSVKSVSWFHPRARLKTEYDFTKPLYELIAEHSGIVPVCSEEQVSAALAGKELARTLDCGEEDPILVRTRVVSDAGGLVIEYNENYYRADRFTYGLKIRKGS